MAHNSRIIEEGIIIYAYVKYTHTFLILREREIFSFFKNISTRTEDKQVINKKPTRELFIRCAEHQPIL